MAVTFVGATLGAGSAINLPATVTGDVLIAHTEGNTRATVPAGWTLLGYEINTDRHFVMWKLAGAAETAPAGSYSGWAVAAYRGASAPYVDAFEPAHIGTAVFGGIGSQMTMTGLTATALDMLVWSMDVYGGGFVSTAPSGMTARVPSGNTALIYDRPLAATGPTPPEQITIGGGTGSQEAFFASLLIKGDPAYSANYVPAVML